MSLYADAITVRLGDSVVLADVSIALRPGRVTALIGPNGAGKSTLLRVASGDVEPQGGSVTVGGRLIGDYSVQKLAEVRAVMGQTPAVMFDFTVEEVVRMGWVQDGIYLHDAAERAFAEVTEACETEALLGRTYRTLSGGEQRRVQFARALLQIWREGRAAAVRYLLLDEPTANLDLAHELAVLRLARRVANDGAGVLAVLHDLNLAARFADDMTLLHNGRVVSSGAPGRVLDADTLASVYGTAITVEQHATLDRLVVYS